MISQYLRIKEENPGAILFFRMGDFYEMFFEDAQEASKILDIALTSRNRDKSGPIPMCGVPYHAAASYISKLIGSGRKVAICEQVEDPRKAKGLVKREIVRVITPGLTLEDRDLDARSNNYLAAVLVDGDSLALAAVDVGTGEFKVAEFAGEDDLIDELVRIEPSEILVPEDVRDHALIARAASASTPRMVNALDSGFFEAEAAAQSLETAFGAGHLERLRAMGLSGAVRAAGAACEYLRQTQMTEAVHLKAPQVQRMESHMVVDESTKRNLELFCSLIDRSRKGSLLGVLDRTVTPMGARKLKQWMNYPLLDPGAIRERLEAVAEAVENYARTKDLREALSGVMDLERLISRISLGTGNARDLVQLRAGLERIPGILSTMQDLAAARFAEIRSRIDPLEDVTGLVARAIVDEPPITVREGGIIRDGYNAELDELLAIGRDGKGWILGMEARERKRTGIQNLKVRYNKVFGYYIEVTKSNLDAVPDDYDRKQTLVNAERFITPELKEHEARVLEAEDRRTALEYDLFTDVRGQVAAQAARVQATAEALAEVDVLLAFAEVSVEYRYRRPEISDSEEINVLEGRHPVVERLMAGEPFVPNDVRLNCSEDQILIITGPNMAGKSTYIRQVALIVLMAQIGCFVPAERADIGVVDRIFTRVGASDNLARGQSTFMVEMTETANILRNATRRSLVVLDEIGRGTSTFDGLSIAWSVAEFLHDQPGLRAKTLFATHYHELTELNLTKPRVKNYNIAVREWNDRIIFLRKIVEGGSNRSYGIQVARLAGLPEEVLQRSKEILANLERGELDEMGRPRLARPKDRRGKAEPGQLQLFTQAPATHPVVEELESLNTDGMTPLEALNALAELKKKLE